MYYLSMLIAIAGLTTYQIVMKQAPRGTNPWGLMAMVYFLAGVCCVAAAPLWRRWVAPSETMPGVATLAPAALISVAVILIEIGYLLVYRSGWSVSVAPAVAQAATITLVCLMGWLAVGEKVTASAVGGLVLCVAGVFLLTRKS